MLFADNLIFKKAIKFQKTKTIYADFHIIGCPDNVKIEKKHIQNNNSSIESIKPMLIDFIENFTCF